MRSRVDDQAVLPDVAALWSGKMSSQQTLLLSALAQHDAGAYAHSLRVARLALQLTRAVAPQLHEQVLLVALFHEIGRLSLSHKSFNEPQPMLLVDVQRWIVHNNTSLLATDPQLAELESSIAAVLVYPFQAPKALVDGAKTPAVQIVSLVDYVDLLASGAWDGSVWPSDDIRVVLEDEASGRWDASLLAAVLPLLSTGGSPSS